MTLLELVQEFSESVGVTRPSLVIGSQSTQVKQMKALLNKLPEDLLQRNVTQVNVKEAVFVTVAGEDQGPIEALAPGFAGIVMDTFFDRTRNLTVSGGVRPDEWQALKAVNFSGPLPMFRIRNDRLYLTPNTAEGSTLAFEYVSRYFINSADVLVERLANDSDTFTVRDGVVLAWLDWRWKKEKGLEYAEEFSAYERSVSSLFQRQNSPRAVRMDHYGCEDFRPGIVVPLGGVLVNP